MITFPQDGATCNEIVTIGIDANDPDGICGVEVSVNDLKIDIPLSEILGKINEEPLEIKLNTNDLLDGPVEIAVSICDCNGNCTESPPLNYEIDNTLSVPDTIEIISAMFNNGGFDIRWEKSNASDFNQYDLYHSLTENFDDFSLIHTSNDINNMYYFLDNTNPLILNYFYITVTDSFSYSSSSSIYASSLDPKPIAIHIESVSYDESIMNVLWSESQDTDFLKYELYQGSDTTNTSLLETILDKSEVSFSINNFDPHSYNYFRIIVYDTLNQSTKGNFLSNMIQPIPDAVNLDPIDSFGNELTIVWSVYPTNDFQLYNLYLAYDLNMTNKEIIFTTSNRTDNSYFSADNDYETTYYFQVSIMDDWGYEVFSNIESIDPEYVTFIKSYNSGSEVDIGYRAVQTTTGKYKILGKTGSDVTLIGTDRSGMEPTFNYFSYGPNDTPVDLISNYADGYIFLSNIINSNSDTDIRITKTDQNGLPIWNVIHGSVDPYDQSSGNADFGLDLANDISQTADGGYVITGQYNTVEERHWDIWILKLNDFGEKENEHILTAFPESEQIIENGRAILEINNGYIILGSLHQYDLDAPSDIWLSHFDLDLSDNGDTLWSSIWDIGPYDYPTSMVSNLEGGYTIAGYSSNSNSGDEGSSWIIKSDFAGEGDILTSFSGNNFIYSMIEDENGSYILAGKKTENSNTQGWIISIGPTGVHNWEKLYGNESIDAFYSIKQTSDRGFILSGETFNNGLGDILHVKTDPNGNVISQ